MEGQGQLTCHASLDNYEHVKGCRRTQKASVKGVKIAMKRRASRHRLRTGHHSTRPATKRLLYKTGAHALYIYSLFARRSPYTPAYTNHLLGTPHEEKEKETRKRDKLFSALQKPRGGEFVASGKWQIASGKLMSCPPPLPPADVRTLSPFRGLGVVLGD
nr:hypothetical protein L203_03022 [Cryptococcus depauperatus CBS 7841]